LKVESFDAFLLKVRNSKIVSIFKKLHVNYHHIGTGVSNTCGSPTGALGHVVIYYTCRYMWPSTFPDNAGNLYNQREKMPFHR